jgi:peptidoglycan/xylan/chitin deacetylase (PgdA/CDA1 family)
MRKCELWYVSFTASILGIFVFGPLRQIFMIISTLHIPLFIWGVSNIRSGFFGPVKYKCDDPRRLALTFDDGPDPTVTPEVLDLLDKYSLKATFFVIGKKAAQYPGLVKDAFDRGHCIASHDLTHSYLSNFRLSKQMTKEILESQKIIEKIIGKKPLLYRPPVGLTNPHLFKALGSLGMNCIGWDRRVRDSGNRRMSRFSKFPSLAVPGSVVLLHDCMPNVCNREAFLYYLEKLFLTMDKKGISSTTVEELFGIIKC